MNKVRVSIGGQDFTKFATVPLTLQNTLNDTLDSAQATRFLKYSALVGTRIR